ncbi:hypothetical protein ACHQM5_003382 [Ranunculus cassubicifolius]
MRDDDEVISGSDDVPSDALRCNRGDGKGWRCKFWKRPGRTYCKKHDQSKERLGLYVHQHDYEDDDDDDIQVGKKRRRFTENRSCRCCCSAEEENVILRKKLDKRDNRKLSENKENEECHILDLLCWLKTIFPNKEFEMVEHIFKIREMKLKRKKKEAERCTLQLVKELRVYENKFDKLLDELDEKRKQVVVAEGKAKEFEFIKSLLEDEDCEYDKVCYQLKERVGYLEKGLENACKREKGALQRIKELEFAKTQQDRIRELECGNTRAGSDEGLQDRIRDLECANTRAESEIEFWKKMFKDLETRVLVEPQALRKISEEPRRVCSAVSYAEEQKKSESKQGETNSTLQKVKEENLNFDGRGCAQRNEDSLAKQSDFRELADEGKSSENNQPKNPNETSGTLNDAWCSRMKIVDRAWNCEDRIYSCANVDFVSRSLAKESGPVYLSENGKNTESPPTKIQTETSCALSGTCSTPFKSEEEGLKCDLTENGLASILLSLSQESKVSQLAVSEGNNNCNKVGNSYEDTSRMVIGRSCMEDEQNPVDTKILQQLNSGAHCHSDSSYSEKVAESSLQIREKIRWDLII